MKEPKYIVRQNSNGTILSITHKETNERLPPLPSRIFHKLWINRGKELEVSDVITEIWGEYNYFIGRSFDVHLNRVKKFLIKIESPLQIIRYGRGKIFLGKKNELEI